VSYRQVPILVVGESGTGKSTMAEDLPVGEVLIINTENKVMPDREASKHSTKYVKSVKQMMALLDALRDPDKLPEDKQAEYKAYKYVFFDSATASGEIIEKYCAVMFSGYSQWGKHNELVYDMISKFKDLPQQLIVTALPEQKAEGFNEVKLFAKMKGKEYKYGYIESQFTIVLFTKPEYAEDDIPNQNIYAGDMTACYMQYKPTKFSTAKSPRGMFDGKVPNSAKAIIEAVNKYYGYES
jgi:hypothetical protein